MHDRSITPDAQENDRRGARCPVKTRCTERAPAHTRTGTGTCDLPRDKGWHGSAGTDAQKAEFVINQQLNKLSFP
jgi:hypothetical protein